MYSKIRDYGIKRNKEVRKSQEELLEGEKRLAKGGFALIDAKKLALKMRYQIRD